jgi:NitT/TauT family transport system permease protein
MSAAAEDHGLAGPPQAGAAERTLRIALPIVMLLALIAAWQVYVVLADVPHYILPSPWRIAQALYTDWPVLLPGLYVTVKITFIALGIALVGGVALAMLMAQSRWIELALYPYAVILQVTPIVAIAPLIIIYAPTTQAALLICAWIVAFFPIVSNTTLGLRSTDRNLSDLFRLYRAGRWQTLRYLKLPTALPYFFAGVRISGGLALIGAVVAEFVAGTGGTETGLASRILEAGNRLQIPRLFAALFLLAVAGVLIYLALGWITNRALRHWHESALPEES